MLLDLRMVQDPLQFQLELGIHTQCEELNEVSTHICPITVGHMYSMYSLSSVSVAEVCDPSTVMLRLTFICPPRIHPFPTPSVCLLRRAMSCGGVLETAT